MKLIQLAKKLEADADEKVLVVAKDPPLVKSFYLQVADSLFLEQEASLADCVFRTNSPLSKISLK